MTGGRPLRFLALTLGGWVAVRIALLMPDAPLPTLARAAPLPTLVRAPPSGDARAVPRPHVRAASLSAPLRRHAVIVAMTRRAASLPPSPKAPTPPPLASIAQTLRPRPSPYLPPIPVSRARRFGGSAWVLARGGGGGTLSGGQLGASQAGVQITYALGESRRVALAARLAAPLRGIGREAALGVEWQPTALPVRLIAEQRFALDGARRGARGGPTLGAIGGYGPAEIVHGVRLEAYGQAGAIYRARVEAFVDASARATHPIGRVAGARIEAGLGAWGSAQRDAARLDMGPSLVTTVPLAGRSLRLTLDWRERVAGRARPGSGPALSIGSDF